MVNIWQSSSDDVFKNMALETWLLKEDQANHVFFWVNQPAVVIGRNQIPWHEVALENVFNDDVAFARRISGGGAVYHDKGNLNISFIGGASKSQNIADVLAVLANLGIEAHAGSRNEILIGDSKISGSAYYYHKKRFLHHLTLLVDADLTAVWKYLLAHPPTSNSKAVASVRQRVGNISDIDKSIDITRIMAAFADYYQAPLQTLDANTVADYQAHKLYQTWAWNYGQTPSFTVVQADKQITVNGGIISAVSGGNPNDQLFVGKTYHPTLFYAADADI